MARPAPGAWSVADNLAGIELTPDDLERLELFRTAAGVDVGRCSTTWGSGRHAFLMRFRPAMHAHGAAGQGTPFWRGWGDWQRG
jgi:hypothetical protein